MKPIEFRRLVLHPGSPKTGTSAIQNALHGMRDLLFEQGFLYPLAGMPARRGLARGHHDIALHLDPAHTEPVAPLRDAIEALRAEMAAAPDHAVILSSEEFFGRGRLEVLKQILRPATCHVYVCLRPQHEMLNANYYTQVTHKRIDDAPNGYFDLAVEDLKYLDTVTSLAEFAPSTRLSLRLFEKGAPARSGPLRDFAAQVGIELPGEAATDPVEHPTLPALATLFLRWLNEMDFDQQSFFNVFQSLHRMREHLPKQIYTMSPARIEAVTRRFDAENREIRRRFLNGHDAPLFNPPEIPDAAQWEAEVGENHVRAERIFLMRLCALAAQNQQSHPS